MQNHWAPYIHRFVILKDGQVIGTVGFGKDKDIIVYKSRWENGVSALKNPGFKPDGYHQMVNLAVMHDVRRAKLATIMINSVMNHFADKFDGKGIWIRGDPPWHNKLQALGFRHDASMDSFLPPSAERTDGLPHALYNRKFKCSCGHDHPERPNLLAVWEKNMSGEGGADTPKLQYFSMTRDFPQKLNLDQPPKINVPPLY